MLYLKKIFSNINILRKALKKTVKLTGITATAASSPGTDSRGCSCSSSRRATEERRIQTVLHRHLAAFTVLEKEEVVKRLK